MLWKLAALAVLPGYLFGQAPAAAPAAAAAIGSSSPSSFSIPNSPVQADLRQGVTVYLANSENKPCEATPTIIDLDQQGPGATWGLNSGPTRNRERNAALFLAMKWNIGGVPLGGSSSRRLRVVGNNRAGFATLTVRNQVYPDQTVTFASSPNDLSQHVRRIEIPVTVQGAPLTEATVSYSSLVDPVSGLGVTAHDFSVELIRLDDQNLRIALSLGPSFQNSGNFTGQVFFSNRERPLLGSVTLSVHSTSTEAKVYGIAFIVGGMILFAVLTAWRQNAKYKDAMLPAAALAAKAAALKGQQSG